MTKQEALEYCYKHRNEYIRDTYDCGEDGIKLYDCLISCLESGHIKPEQLKEYGMDFQD